MIDSDIRDYIIRINNLSFVKTIFSCQGHFCRSIQKSVIYYHSKNESKLVCNAVKSRFKNPYVLLEFSNHSIAKKFVVFYIQLRRWLYRTRKVWLHIVTPKNNKFVEEKLISRSVAAIAGFSVVISRFDKVRVSVSYTFPSYKGLNYYKNKRECDLLVKVVRVFLFTLVTSTLDELVIVNHFL